MGGQVVPACYLAHIHGTPSSTELPFYKKHPKRTAVAAGIVGGIVLTPVAVGALSYLGLTTAGFAAGNLNYNLHPRNTTLTRNIGSAAFSYQSLVYSTATRVVLVSLQSAGTTGAVMPSVGTILTGAATTGTGALVAATNTKSVTSTSGELLKQAAESIVHDEKLGDDNESPPPYNATAPEEYHLTPRAIIAIVKSWNIQTYNPPRTKCSTWLSDVHNLCEQYEIPTSQQASCAMHHMRNDCHEAAINAGCCNMTWDEFAMWLRQYDRRLHNFMLSGLPADRFVRSARNKCKWYRSPLAAQKTIY